MGVLRGRNGFAAASFSASTPQSEPEHPIGSPMIQIEFYGVPRLRAGMSRLRLEASSVGQALRGLVDACPALNDSVLPDGRIEPAYKLSLNGERFVSDPQTPLSEGDVLLLLSADVGG